MVAPGFECHFIPQETEETIYGMDTVTFNFTVEVVITNDGRGLQWRVSTALNSPTQFRLSTILYVLRRVWQWMRIWRALWTHLTDDNLRSHRHHHHHHHPMQSWRYLCCHICPISYFLPFIHDPPSVSMTMGLLTVKSKKWIDRQSASLSLWPRRETHGWFYRIFWTFTTSSESSRALWFCKTIQLLIPCFVALRRWCDWVFSMTFSKMDIGYSLIKDHKVLYLSAIYFQFET